MARLNSSARVRRPQAAQWRTPAPSREGRWQRAAVLPDAPRSAGRQRVREGTAARGGG